LFKFVEAFAVFEYRIIRMILIFIDHFINLA